MSVTRHYTILLHPDPETSSYGVTVPALPGCVTQGMTIEEAIAMAREAIQLHIEGLLADAEPIPDEPAHLQAIVIDVAA